MGILKNPRWEKFAQAVSKGASYTKAYMTAGYDSSEEAAGRSGSALMKNPEISGRVAGLQAEWAKRHKIDKDRLTQMFLEDRDLARTNAQSGAAVSATSQLAKMHGYMVEKHEHGQPGEFAKLDEMSATELAAFIYGDDDETRTEH